MRPEDEIHELMEKLRVDPTAEMDKRVHGDISKTLAELRRTIPAEQQPVIWRVIMKSPITKLAAAAAIIIGLFIVLGDKQQTLYAQIVEALEQTRTFHALIKEYRDGQWFKDHEIWYDREAGIVEEERYQDRTDVRIDNGKYEWRYAAGSDSVSRLDSYRANEYVKQLCGEWIRDDPNRAPAGDKIIDGLLCKMYTLSDRSGELSIWVDGGHRVRQFEQSVERFGQRIQYRATIEYDIAMDKQRFLPAFDSTMNVKVLNPRQLIEQQFPLDRVVFTRECLGFVFAVHKLESCGDGFKYLVCSNRLSDKTRVEIGTGHPWTYYGSFSLFSREPSEDGYSDSPQLLARMKHDGIQVDWYLLAPVGNAAERVTTCDVDLLVNAANQLEQKCKAEGLPTHEKFRLNLRVQEGRQHPTSMSKVVSEVYSLGKQFDPIVHSFRLAKVVTTAGGGKTLSWKRPLVEISKHEYAEDIERRVEEWCQRNMGSQRKCPIS